MKFINSNRDIIIYNTTEYKYDKYAVVFQNIFNSEQLQSSLISFNRKG